MKYLLKLANGEGKGYFELVNKYTYDNYKFALADDEISPRYELNDWVVVNDDGTISIHLNSGSRQDLGILLRGLDLPAATGAVPGGFIREPHAVTFRIRNSLRLLNLKTGKLYKEAA